MDAGTQDRLTEVIVMGMVIATAALPVLVPSWTDVAVIVAVPAFTGVKTPVLLIAPMLDGLTDQVTALLKFPVPATIGVQAAA